MKESKRMMSKRCRSFLAVAGLFMAMAPASARAQANPNLVSCSLVKTSVQLCPGESSQIEFASVSPDPAVASICNALTGCTEDLVASGVFGTPATYESLVAGFGTGVPFTLSFGPPLPPGSLPGDQVVACSFTVTALSEADCGVIDTDAIDISEPFAQITDANVDTWTVRGKVTETPTSAATVVSDGVANGVTVTMYESSAPTFSAVEPMTPGLGQVDTYTFEPGDCTAISRGRTLYCKDPADNSFFRARKVRSTKDPDSFRLTGVIRGRELEVQHPYDLPLVYDVELNGRLWVGNTDIRYCRVTLDGVRTTCRLPRAGRPTAM